ncbi:hypothetical protein JCM30471_20280 [Desulfuromonas carbonis]|uniref:hypothetical protein n=1 Tax=Desulfuromonas sp. DDH964 TaxID=1823759 RepID=UPI00078D1347|nr:hypothetical protein [Desulfuromonas sp. DDH964]AMV73611.1 hypothetical protein DBW_3311 [Desulfuromonas sp. DDH964]
MASPGFNLLQSLYCLFRRQLLRRNHTLANNWAGQSLTTPPALNGPTDNNEASFHIELSGRHRRKLLRALHLSGIRH